MANWWSIVPSSLVLQPYFSLNSICSCQFDCLHRLILFHSLLIYLFARWACSVFNALAIESVSIAHFTCALKISIQCLYTVYLVHARSWLLNIKTKKRSIDLLPMIIKLEAKSQVNGYFQRGKNAYANCANGTLICFVAFCFRLISTITTFNWMNQLLAATCYQFILITHIIGPFARRGFSCGFTSMSQICWWAGWFRCGRLWVLWLQWSCEINCTRISHVSNAFICA